VADFLGELGVGYVAGDDDYKHVVAVGDFDFERRGFVHGAAFAGGGG